jgi:hypothetical protein
MFSLSRTLLLLSSVFPQKRKAAEIAIAFRENRRPPPPPSPISTTSPLPIASTPTDPNVSPTCVIPSTPPSSGKAPAGPLSTPQPLGSARSQSPTAQSPTTTPTPISNTPPECNNGSGSPEDSGKGTPLSSKEEVHGTKNDKVNLLGSLRLFAFFSVLLRLMLFLTH